MELFLSEDMGHKVQDEDDHFKYEGNDFVPLLEIYLAETTECGKVITESYCYEPPQQGYRLYQLREFQLFLEITSANVYF